MLVTYSGNNYKDAEKVNKHIKEVAIESLPANTPFDELNPSLTPGQKLYILQMLGFKPQQNGDSILKGHFQHIFFAEGEAIDFDVNTDELFMIVNKTYKTGYYTRMNEEC